LTGSFKETKKTLPEYLVSGQRYEPGLYHIHTNEKRYSFECNDQFAGRRKPVPNIAAIS
jgi:hypothetical protein